MTRVFVFESCIDFLIVLLVLAVTSAAPGQESQLVNATETDGIANLLFDNSIGDELEKLKLEDSGKNIFVRGLSGQAIRFGSRDANEAQSSLKGKMNGLPFATGKDFSLQFWVRTTARRDQKMVLLSTKDFPDNGLASQKRAGWMFGCFNGTWAWNMGSGRRRISYDRTNGQFMPINDGRWHQLAMTHSAGDGLVRLYIDGRNMVTYNVRDSGDFDFQSDQPLTIGWSGEVESRNATELPVFIDGADQLQKLVDEFNRFGLPAVNQDEFKQLVTRPARLFEAKIKKLKELGESRHDELIERLESADLKPLETLSRKLMRSPYTVHQSSDYNEVALVFKLYRLEDGKVVMDKEVAGRLAKREILSSPSFDLDELKIWNRVVTPDEVMADYAKYFEPVVLPQPKNLKKLVAGCWNIHHGGLHESIEEDGWDSRQVIIDLLKQEQIDVVMMQETYSAGDHIAAELGFYYATTIDWDNMHQGANISVMSRYPIKEVYVPPKSTFMNVAAKVSLSQTQNIFVLSSWYGMRNFEDVFDFHKSRFAETDSLPVLFAGDFNAVPDGDGGDSLAARKLLAAGFTDAYRKHYPDPKENPGPTHESNRRIDQLYFKGSGLNNTSTEILSEWPSRFPADHFLIKSVFELGYSSNKKSK